MKQSTPASSLDFLRQVINLLAAPLIWICSSLGFIFDSARSPAEFSNLSQNLLVPQTFAFSIWFPIFLGILAYGILQALRVNRTRSVFRQTGWWVAAGLWGIVAWGLITAYVPKTYVEILATLVFIPTMVALVVAMIKFSRLKPSLDTTEHWLVLTPISLIAGWCSLAVFVGLNGVVWNIVKPLGWGGVVPSIFILVLALSWAMLALRKADMNRIYAFPIIWGLGFLALRHLGGDEKSVEIGSMALIGIALIMAPIFFKIQLLETRNSAPAQAE